MVALERGWKGIWAFSQRTAVRRRRKRDGPQAHGRQGQGGSGGEAEGADQVQTPVRNTGDRRQGPGREAARPAPQACSGLKSRGSHLGGEGQVPGSNVQTGKHRRTSEAASLCPPSQES